MGCFGIRNDQVLFEQFLSQFNQNNTIHLATAYFNLAPELAEQIYRSQAHWKVLTAAPQANGFFNSGGVSRYIPGAYLDREYQFLRHKPEKADIQMFEWFKEGETFHAKGLWSSTEQLGTYLSICGSSNWGNFIINMFWIFS
jgi:CDP-diacylglycerol--glycerol-3-phosphate 3-phosphatidyltransferase